MTVNLKNYFPSFIRALSEYDHLLVPSGNEPDEYALAEAAELLTEMEAQWRLNCPADMPLYNKDAALWAAGQFYKAAQFFACRAIGPDIVRDELLQDCPEEYDASTLYSIDLVFRFLPSLYKTAKAVSEGDILLDCIREMAVAFPLSSVGITIEDANFNVDTITENTGLLTLYAERILDYSDTTRLSDETVQEKLRTIIGSYPKLNQEISDLLEIKI
ncbi:MAG: hypothetical protein HRT89_03940 [Lentisphaeria bacterium]|nr:hypothetical protein [Lentisphaeria bacterium]NQZ67201.1 hypothetical protein [Lentisphaeria bacterium]